jgi:CRP-like cAMP-binding protein
MELSQFDKENQRWLQYAIAAFLNIAPDNVRITSVEESNGIKVKVAVDLPKEALAEVFKDLNEESLSKLLNSSRIHRLKVHEVFPLRSTLPNLYLILNGYVSLRSVARESKEESFLGWRGPGQIFGEVMEIGAESVSIKPTELIITASSKDCVLLEVSSHVLIEVANDAPYLYRNIAKLLMQNMYQEQDHLRILQTATTKGQVAQTIIKLHRERGYDESEQGQIIKGNVFQRDIASFIGSHYATVARGMFELKRERIIDFSKSGKITILNLQGLESIAAGSWRRKYD